MNIENFPLVSIGIPTYNRPESLERIITCLLKQTYVNFEIIISDNASTDLKVVEITNQYKSKDNRIKVFRQDSNLGMIKNFYFVEKEAKGDFFMWFSDDDYIEDENFILTLYTQLIAQNAHFCFPECIMKQENNVKAFQGKYKACSSVFEYVNNFISPSYMGYEFYGLYNRKLIKENGWDFLFLDIENATDIHYLIRLFLENKVHYCPDTQYIFDHKPNVYSVNRMKRHIEDHLFAYRECLKLVSFTDNLSKDQKEILLDKILNKYDALVQNKFNLPLLSLLKQKLNNRLKLKRK